VSGQSPLVGCMRGHADQSPPTPRGPRCPRNVDASFHPLPFRHCEVFDLLSDANPTFGVDGIVLPPHLPSARVFNSGDNLSVALFKLNPFAKTHRRFSQTPCSIVYLLLTSYSLSSSRWFCSLCLLPFKMVL